MARKSVSSSNIYGRIDHSEAIDIADRSMRGEILHAPDGFGLTDTLHTEIKKDVTVHNDSNSGHPDKARTHKGDIDGGSDSVTNNRASHEKKPIDYESAGADAYKSDHEGTDED